MTDEADRRLVGVVLAAGEGRRLRPLTELRAKALCPVNNVPLVDHALARVRPHVADIAVNVHHHRDQLVAHLAGRVHLSVEEAAALGTAGALGALREWVAGRPVLVHNADAFLTSAIEPVLAGWDGLRCRLAVQRCPGRGDFGEFRFVGLSLLPWRVVRELEPMPSGLYERVWRAAWQAGQLELVEIPGTAVDCGTPADYLRANLVSTGGHSVVGAGARVDGELVRSVVWPAGVVRRGERLVECIRVGSDLTVAAPLGTANAGTCGRPSPNVGLADGQ